MLDQQHDAQRLRWRERAVGALAVLAVLLWTVGGVEAMELGDGPRPAHYALTLMVATALSVIAVLLIAIGAIAARLDNLGRRVETLEATTRQRDEAWAAVNALLASTGERPILRPVPRINTGPN